METNLMEWKAALITVAGVLTGFWGWMGWLVAGWVLCMALDYLTGVAAACAHGSWSSRVAVQGIFHKLGSAVVVVAAAGLDLLLSTALEQLPILALPVEYKGLICPVAVVWYLVMELGSICENAVEMGAPVPPFLRKLLAVSKQAVDELGGDVLDADSALHDKE